MPAFVGTIQGNQLIIKVLVSKPQVANTSTPDQESFTALLDTGATITSVSKQVVDVLGIQPVSWKDIVGVHDSEATPTYAVGLHIPVAEHGVTPEGAPVVSVFGRSKSPLEVALLKFVPTSFDVLLGMDVLRECHLTTFRDIFILGI